MQSPELGRYKRTREPPHDYYVRPDWEPHLLEHLRNDFETVRPEDRTLHTGGRVEHFSYQPEGAPGPVLVRRASRGSVFAALGDLHAGASRFFKELRFNEEARQAGVPVPEIVAGRLSRAGLLFHRYLYVVRAIPGATNLHQFARAAGTADKRRAVRAFAKAVRRMHDAGIYHGDLTLRNVLVTDDGNGMRIYFIDFDRGRGGSQPAEANLHRLNRFVEKWGHVTRTDKLRFLLAYAGDRDAARKLARRRPRGLWLHRLWWTVTGHSK
ncbi:MAG: lipopolysaccharide kinase InaA family protein [Planctomycetota bacterium]|jgi:tRNA A-37 threonylcarbamoyl transferase component Bud32